MFTMFEDLGAGVYQASDELVAFWESRDTCPDCGAITEPVKTVDGVHHYVCPESDDHDEATWTRKA